MGKEGSTGRRRCGAGGAGGQGWLGGPRPPLQARRAEAPGELVAGCAKPRKGRGRDGRAWTACGLEEQAQPKRCRGPKR